MFGFGIGVFGTGYLPSTAPSVRLDASMRHVPTISREIVNRSWLGAQPRAVFAASTDKGRSPSTRFCSSRKDNLPVRMVAIDGFRLALVEKEVEKLTVVEELRVLILKEAAHQARRVSRPARGG